MQRVSELALGSQRGQQVASSVWPEEYAMRITIEIAKWNEITKGSGVCVEGVKKEN